MYLTLAFLLQLLFGFAAVLQLWVAWQFSKLNFKAPALTKINSAPLSILICSRNDATALANNLPAILRQQYPNFEVLVVDDASTDVTPSILADFCLQFPHLRVIRKEEKKSPGKKEALRWAIQHAKHDLLLLTDADCQPATPLWAQNMCNSLIPTAEVVLGLGFYTKAPKKLLHYAVQYETLLTALQYQTAAQLGHPYMGVGRNLLYKKSLVAQADFEKHSQLASGDDDLLLNPILKSGQVQTCLSKAAITYSSPPNTWQEWIRQKTRHLSTAPHYKTSDKIMLALYAGSDFVFGVFWIFAVCINPWWGIVLLLRWLLFWRMYSRCSKQWDALSISFPALLFTQLCWPLYYIYFGCSAYLFSAPKKGDWG